MNFLIFAPNFHTRNERMKKRADLLIVEANKKRGNEISHAPALIVKTLNGIINAKIL